MTGSASDCSQVLSGIWIGEYLESGTCSHEVLLFLEKENSESELRAEHCF